ncbi:hypothetical protein WSM22_21620 [Cytophagales bacterium WSM2-2]|nr:hypothetical protein WSM22_21620 [Cytophagales bacterium WSM2-2]
MAVANLFSFHTIDSTVHSIFKEKGSKFLGFAYPVANENDIKSKLETLRKTHFDATHHCYAWVLGPDKKHFRSNDDGEPNHSAGTPILGQIRSKNLTNILIVVVRYFGGTKLGVSGLIQAYRTAAELTLANTKIIEVEMTSSFTLDYDYSFSSEVMRLVKDFDVAIKTQSYDEIARIDVEVKLRNQEKFLAKLKLLQATGVKVSVIELN